MVVLKNWSIFIHFNDLTKPKEHTLHLEGDIYGIGDHIGTSAIISIIDKGNYKEVTTRSGTVYAIYKDDVDTRCEELLPGYYDQIGESI